MEAWPSPNDLSRAFKYGYYRLSNDISLIGKMTEQLNFQTQKPVPILTAWFVLFLSESSMDVNNT